MLSLIFFQLSGTDSACGLSSLPCAPVRNAIQMRPSSGRKARCQVRPCSLNSCTRQCELSVHERSALPRTYASLIDVHCGQTNAALLLGPLLCQYRTHSVAFNFASRSEVAWERKCIQERRNGLSQKHVFPMNSPNCSHVSGGQAYRIIYSALDRLVILIIAPSRKAGWQVGVTSVIFGSLGKVAHAFFCLTCGNGFALGLDCVLHSCTNNAFEVTLEPPRPQRRSRAAFLSCGAGVHKH